MESSSFFTRYYKKIGTAFLVFVGFFLVFFSVSRSKDSAYSGHATLTGVAHADVPPIATDSGGGDGGDSGDDGGGDCGDSGDSGGK